MLTAWQGAGRDHLKGLPMSQIVYIVGAIVIVLFVLSLIGFA